MITLAVLLELVELMKAPSKHSSIQSRHRKMVASFRDYHLLSIFKFALKLLDSSTSEYEAAAAGNTSEQACM